MIQTGGWRLNRYDVLLALITALFGVGDSFTFTGTSDNLIGADRVASALVCALGALALLLRRRWPIAVAAVSALVHALAFAPMQLVVALYAAGMYGRPTARVIAVSACTVVLQIAVALVAAVREDPHVPPIIRALFLVPVYLAGTVGGLLTRRYTGVMEERTALLRAERERAAGAARLDERARIAREMHDVVAYRVSLMVVDAGALEVSRDQSPVWVTEVAGRIRASGRMALEELREMLGVLSGQFQDSAGDGPLVPGALVPGAPEPREIAQPSMDGIDALISSHQKRGMNVSMSIGGVRRPLGEVACRAVYRLIQESLTNALKHAPGAWVQVIVEFLDDRLEVKVINGPPPGAQHPLSLAGSGSGSGLAGSEQRISLLGGDFKASPLPGGGFRVRAVLPFESISGHTLDAPGNGNQE